MNAATATIDQPGVYDIPVDRYLADPVAGGSLSSSGARKLLPPSCPAKFKQWLDEGSEHIREYDIGHGAHRLVLGTGPELVVIDADGYRTKAARAARDEAYAAGAVPLLAADAELVHAMADALREHPVASALFAPGSGQPEQTLVWFDQRHGVRRRALVDWLRCPPPGGQLIVPDYKSAKSADPDAISKAIDQYGYDQQLAWYLDGVQALGLAGDVEPAAVLVVQETAPPYLITVVQLDVVALERGQLRNQQALTVYRQCRATDRWLDYAEYRHYRETGDWPGNSTPIVLIGLPPWAERQHEIALERGDYELGDS
ncbi:MAG TPA: PD-(D/E)XK nuclease-like domain-containing protein [Actinophytocola sp.]|uniref:PD-(D/E)XK nuclease-like domain-containing protein n=1 Tax=Actinophytocola sp. TaxID=1872138 RepID=UPI002DDC90CD|nr:PD-(D/E)XK nuclease-like domain-containing protein [Actinophytocola sp.]HEV2780386.1 PD-(D/E)XK nuclease-like domain-containing protein [Actinophytocola sp.]